MFRKPYPNELVHGTTVRVNSAYDYTRAREQKRKRRQGGWEAQQNMLSNRTIKDYNANDNVWFQSAILRVLGARNSGLAGIKWLTSNDPKQVATIATEIMDRMGRENLSELGGLTFGEWSRLRDLANKGYTSSTEVTANKSVGGSTVYSWSNKKGRR